MSQSNSEGDDDDINNISLHNSTPSDINSDQDRINRKILQKRLSKERKLEYRSIQQGQNESNEKEESPHLHSPRPWTIEEEADNKIPFTPASLFPNVPPKLKTHFPEMEELVSSNEKESSSIIYLGSKPGSRSILKNAKKSSEISNLNDYNNFNPNNNSNPIKNVTTSDKNASSENVNHIRMSERPIAIFRGYDELISSLEEMKYQAKLKMDETVLDVIKLGKDEATHITIIPADEMKVIELEFQDWKRHRIIFLILAGFTFILGMTINILSVYSAGTFYTKVQNRDHSFASLQFVMHANTMIIGTVFVSFLGLIIFRLFPETDRKKIIKIHILIFSGIFIMFLYGGLVIVFKYHKLVTGVPQHVYTLHAMVGILILGFFLFVIGTGIYLVVHKKGPIIKFHSASGMMTFMLCGSCCVSGFLVRAIVFNGKSFTTFDSKTMVNNLTGLLIVVFCLLVRYLATEFRFRRRARPVWDTVFSRTITSFEDENIDRPGSTLQQYVRTNLTSNKI